MSINLLRWCRHAVSLTVAVACLGLLAASPASATTFVVKSTLELEKAVASANQNAEANTIELAAGTYQPTKTLIITNTGGTQTIAGPVGSIGIFTPGAKISGSNVVPVGASEHELITVPIGVSLAVKHVVVTGGGSASNSAIEDQGSLNVENSTIDGNVGTQINVHGGAVASLTNSTLADGLELGMADEGEASFANVTVVHNGIGGIGGTGSGKLSLTNTIVALNEGSAQCGSFSSLTNDHSLASDASCGGEAAFQKKTPLLQTSLSNDGGSTTLYSEKAGSPTIGAGDTAKCPATDQRGYPRPAAGGTGCDIGADQYSSTPPQITVPAEIVTPATSPSGAVVTYSVEASDSDALVKSLSCLPASGATFPVGTTKVECTAVDGHENKAAASFNVTVTTPPPVLPVVTSVVPVEGPEAGGTLVTVKGEHLEGATEAKFGTTTATELKVVSGTEITVKDPAHTPGTIDVTVKTSAGTSTTSSADHFTYKAPASPPAPVVTSVVPVEGPEAGGTLVTVKGEHLEGATEAKFGTTTATELKVVSGTEITVKDPAHTPGTIDVTVKTSAGTSTTSSADHFTYKAPASPPAPVVTSVVPVEGPEAGGTLVTVKGEHLEGATEAKFGTTTATELKVVSGTEITVKDPAHTPGTIDVTVKTSAGTSTTSSADHFTYKAPASPPAPVVTSVVPVEGPEAGGTLVTVKGEHLEGATEAKFGTTTATELKVVSGTEVTVKDPAHTGAGTVDVTVKTSAGTSTTSSSDHFTYQAPAPPPVPVVTGVVPNEGPEAGGTLVTVKGEHLEGATEAKFGTTTATELKVVNGTEITVKDPAHTPGTVDVTVKTPAGTSTTSNNDHFTYQAPAPPPPALPVVTSVAPGEGPEAGGTVVTIKGQHLEGATEAKFGTTTATELKVVSGTEITVKNPTHTAGTVDVTVKTSAGTSATSNTDHFTYQAAQVTPPETTPEVKLRDLLQEVRSSSIQRQIHNELSCLLTDALHSLGGLSGYRHSSKCDIGRLSSRAATKVDRRKSTQFACEDLEQFVDVIRGDQHRNRPKIPAKLATAWSQAANGIEASLGCVRHGRQSSRKPSPPVHGQHHGHRSGGR